MRLKAPPFYREVERSAHCHHHASNLTAVKLAMVITSTNNPDCRQTESLEHRRGRQHAARDNGVGWTRAR